MVSPRLSPGSCARLLAGSFEVWNVQEQFARGLSTTVVWETRLLIVGFGHKARQGKNTAAVGMLSAAPLECHARIYAYADALRAEVKGAIKGAGSLELLVRRGCVGPYKNHVPDACPRECTPLAPWVKVENGKPRTLLQWWGTDYRRAQDQDYWVKRLQETLDRDNPEIALVTDVRFPNEADAIKKLGGYLVKVTRTTKPDVTVPAHPSENALDGYKGWDFHIKADTIRDCHLQAAAIYHKIAGE